MKNWGRHTNLLYGSQSYLKLNEKQERDRKGKIPFTAHYKALPPLTPPTVHRCTSLVKVWRSTSENQKPQKAFPSSRLISPYLFFGEWCPCLPLKQEKSPPNVQSGNSEHEIRGLWGSRPSALSSCPKSKEADQKALYLTDGLLLVEQVSNYCTNEHPSTPGICTIFHLPQGLPYLPLPSPHEGPSG